ncbi:MAG: 2-hydroxychromene-2-carboxylate isomerase [Beijerinckiaceae bacterium]|jgi:2-hydroxychromene-2-carboxylate isomerase
MPQIDFWYEFASTYSYPAAMRIEAAAKERGVDVRWRPFLLGPIFFDQGWRNSPFNIYPAKGRYMWRDVERICDTLGLPFARPDPFPQNSLTAARLALALDEAQRPAFTRAIYAAQFGERRQIADKQTLAEILMELQLDPDAHFARATSDDIKTRLKNETEEAKRLGIFGAPAFVAAGEELFWGNDRLDTALDWAAKRG